MQWSKTLIDNDINGKTASGNTTTNIPDQLAQLKYSLGIHPRPSSS